MWTLLQREGRKKSDPTTLTLVGPAKVARSVALIELEWAAGPMGRWVVGVTGLTAWSSGRAWSLASEQIWVSGPDGGGRSLTIGSDSGQLQEPILE